ncbi:MAG: ArdC family protein [Dysgonomonas sp.]
MKLNNKKLEKVAEKFAKLMIKRISEISGDWQKPWLPVKRKDYLPRNITGRYYSGGNTFMLLLHSLMYDFSTPIFLTFLQADKMGIRITKGSHSFPVYHIAYMYYNPQTHERISKEKFEKIEVQSIKDQYYLIPTPKCYDVFNLDQTNYKDKYPEEWETMLSRHQILPDIIHTQMYENDLLDSVITEQQWVCPIETRFSNRAYYTPGQDRIVLPLKEQFHSGESYYGTAMHEMIHSTGHETRLKRLKRNQSDDDYAKEELVAELSSALMGFYMGMETTLRDDHATYLKGWLEALNGKPAFLMDVLADVVQAVKFMCTHLGYNPFETEPMPSDNSNRPQVIQLVSNTVLTDELTIID